MLLKQVGNLAIMHDIIAKITHVIYLCHEPAKLFMEYIVHGSKNKNDSNF